MLIGSASHRRSLLLFYSTVIAFSVVLANMAHFYFPHVIQWTVPFTVSTKIYAVPAACERHGGVSLAPMTPGIALKTCRCAVRSTPASSGGPGATRDYSSHPWDSPFQGQRKRCSKLLPAILSCLDPPSGRRPGGQSWMRACVPARFP